MSKIKFFFQNYFPKLLIIVGLMIIVGVYYQYILAELTYYYDLYTGKSYKVEVSRNVQTGNPEFQNVITQDTSLITPVDTEFGLVIEKLNVNAPIIKDVSVINEEDYIDALKRGVAHASFSGYPSQEDSNVYLFAHSSNNFWELGRYATVFNQLHKLNPKDQINVFYQGKRYVYEVENLLLYPDFKVDEAFFESIGPTLTLQTCYPAGTTLNRLVVRAALVGIFEY